MERTHSRATSRPSAVASRDRTRSVGRRCQQSRSPEECSLHWARNGENPTTRMRPSGKLPAALRQDRSTCHRIVPWAGRGPSSTRKGRTKCEPTPRHRDALPPLQMVGLGVPVQEGPGLPGLVVGLEIERLHGSERCRPVTAPGCCFRLRGWNSPAYIVTGTRSGPRDRSRDSAGRGATRG